MLAAGAADRDGHEPLALGEVAHGHALEDGQVGREELHRTWLGLHVVGDVGVEPALRPQLGLPVGVGQEAHVGDEVGVDGDAVLEAEADHVDLQPGRVGVAERLADPRGQLVHVEVGGVDHQVGVAAEVGQHLALALQPVEEPARALEGVRPPGRLLAADQDVVAGVEEQQRGVASGRALGEVGVEGLEERAGAYVDHDADLLLRAAGLVDQAHDLAQQAGRQVVHDVEPEVLELLGGRAPAGTRHAGDDDELAAVLRVGNHA